MELSVYNLAGQRLATLVRGERLGGTHLVRWDGKTDGGADLASGIYLYRLRAGGREELRKLMLLR